MFLSDEQRLRTCAASALLICLWCSWTGPAAARDDIRIPNELLTGELPLGFQGILDNKGETVHNVGNVMMNVTNLGIIGSMPGSHQRFDGAPSAQWPSGSGTEYLWAGGLWLGAERNGEIAVSAWETDEERLILEYLPGLSELDRIYRTQELAPGGARRPAANADDDGDGRFDEERLDGRDNDHDGLIDEDFAAISDQMFYCEYRDDDPRLQLQSPEHRPLGILVQQTTMAWGNPQLEDIIAFDFTLINMAQTTLFNLYVGFYADFDIGSRENSAAGTDDLAGFWEGWRRLQIGDYAKDVKLSIGYMFDADGDENRAPGYVGLMFLGAVQRASYSVTRPRPIRYMRRRSLGLRNFQVYSRFSSAQSGGRPSNDADRFAMLEGTAPNALGRPSPGSSLRDAFVTSRTNDYRVLVSADRLGSLSRGDTVSVQMIMVFGNSFDEMVENAVEAQRIYEGFWMDADGDPTTGVDGRELPVCGPAYAGVRVNVDPSLEECDPLAPPTPECWQTVPEDGCVWVNADGDPEYPTGVDGKESLIPWLSPRLPPPAPNMRLVAREGRIEVLWDNRSEKVPDPFLQIVDFESYRIWRADNWNRTPGTSTLTGPGASLWSLMAEYDLPNNGVGRDVGLEEIRYSPGVPEEAVEFYRQWFQDNPGISPPDLPGLTPSQADTAQALARGVRYYHFIDPPFIRGGHLGAECPQDGACPVILTEQGPVPARCNEAGRCAETTTPPPSGSHVFYAVTATDHALAIGSNGRFYIAGPGFVGGPNSNFEYINPPTDPLAPQDFARAKDEIYVVPNPATRRSLADWALKPNNDDPSGVKIEFHHLPRSLGQISIWTLAGDLVKVIRFDARDGNGTAPWNLISRNGQDVASGVYLFTVEADAPGFKTFRGRFVVIR